MDGYRIEINDRIVLTDNLGASGNGEQNGEVQAILASVGDSGVTAARFFVNGVDTLTQGADIVGSYRVPVQRFGNVRLSAAFNDNQTRITHYVENPVLESEVPGLVVFGRAESELLTRGQPRSKLNLSAEWSREHWGATLRTNHYGRVLSPGSNPADDLVIQPAWVTDVELRFARAGWRLALGAQNVLDQYPTSEPTGARPGSPGGYYNVINYFIPFSVLSPFGFSGRFLYGRLSYQF